MGPCPVHGGTRTDAFNIWPDGFKCRGNWTCRSRGCETEFQDTVIGFTHGVLSHQQLGWSRPGDRKVPFKEVIKYLCDFVGQRFDSIRVESVEAEKLRYVRQQEILGRAPEPPPPGWPLEAVLARMEVPSPYYLARGYSAEVLARHRVGTWRPAGRASPMSGRAAVPVLDDAGKRVVMITGRSPFPKCGKCEQFHGDSLCPPSRSAWAVKWYHEGMRSDSVLYNHAAARDHIRRTGAAVLVEGPGDVWRLEEAGVSNAVAIFGNKMSDRQQVILERSGAFAVVGLPHRDEAGEHFRSHLQKELGRAYNLHFLELPAKDVGEMTTSEVRAVVVPELKRLKAY